MFLKHTNYRAIMHCSCMCPCEKNSQSSNYKKKNAEDFFALTPCTVELLLKVIHEYNAVTAVQKT